MKKIIVTAIFLLVIACLLVISWVIIIKEQYVTNWRHITAILLFIPLPILLLKNRNVAVLAIGIYLLLGTFGLLSLTAGISTGFITIAGLEITGFNWLALGLFTLYIIFHLDILIEMQLDYKENMARKRKPLSSGEKDIK